MNVTTAVKAGNLVTGVTLKGNAKPGLSALMSNTLGAKTVTISEYDTTPRNPVRSMVVPQKRLGN